MSEVKSEWLTVKQAAKCINTSLSFIRKAITIGRLPAQDISLGTERSEWRIRTRDLDTFMNKPNAMRVLGEERK